MPMVSYTRNFEDVMLVRALAGIQQGFYVDVGASDPVQDSNTYALYRKGWRGIAIEPQSIFNERWQTLRPEDGLINAAVGAQLGEATLFKPVVYGQAATLNTHFAQDYVQRGIEMEQYAVRVHTLTDVLEQLRASGDIHLLSIDVEGAETDALMGLDLQRFRPWLIVLESTLPGVPTPNFEAWEPILLAADYEFVYFDAVNRFYVAREHAQLKIHFDHPPCVWDDFVSHELAHARQEQQNQRTRLDKMAAWLTASANRFCEQGDMVGCETLLRSVVELHPNYDEAYGPLGTLFIEQGRRAEALQLYEQATVYNPQNYFSHHNIAMLRRWEKRFEESEDAFKRMLAINPHYSEGRMNYGALLLALGRYEEGWALFESRYLVTDDEKPRMSHNAPFARWTGESLVGKFIMLMREQGYGDEIMFVRFAHTLKQLGAARVTVLCQQPIKTLFETALGVDEVVCIETMGDVWPSMDFWCYGQSVPHALHLTVDTIPAPIPYLHPLVADRMGWRGRIHNELPIGTLKVGLTWRGSPQHGNDKNRSLNNLAVLRPLWSVPNVSFVSLQTGEAAQEAREPPAGQPIAEWGSQMNDFAVGAALIAELDLVISVDTAVVHLAGAMGVPCFAMIPFLETDWRWLHDRNDSPWYPVGMRLFRQTAATGWDDVLAQLKDALQEMSTKALC